MKGKMGEGSKAVIGVGVIMLLVFGFLVGSGNLKLGGAQAQFTGDTTATSGTGQTGITTTSLCDGITSLALSVASRNTLNNSLEFQAGAWRIDGSSNGGIPDATGTGTAGATLSYANINVPCSIPNSVGTAYLMSSSVLNSNKGTYSFGKGTGTTLVLPQTDANLANFTLYNSSATAPASPTATVVTETVPTAMSAGDTRNGKIDVQPGVNLYARYGGHVMLDDLPALKLYISFDPGLVWFVDTVDAAAFSDNAVALASTDGSFSLVEIPLTVCNSAFGKGASVDSANRCYVSKAIPTGMATVRLTYVISNDAGSSAGGTSDPVINIEDIQYFEDTDGTIKIGTHDSASTNVGAPQNRITFDNS